uniref:Uncharacterized protein n=1 Tax=Candidatus Kentrum sp. DK TaxID=2126562 RepID=A0A450TCW7_9GAMM|nr:MAG: hypothetical protein BECKDK2373B_GA0170837_11401 [Candidatus Kentron sp. DK]
MNEQQPITLNPGDLQQLLEPLLRRIIREELSKAVEQSPPVFPLNPEMPLYNDMLEIVSRKAFGEIDLLPHDEVWS